MSEADKKRRLNYKKNRQKWIFVQIGAIALLIAMALLMSILFINLNKTYYVSYTERGSADYTVTLKDNAFYEDNAIAGGQGYISELIHNIDASFQYVMLINATNVTYDYSRYIDARLEIIDKKTDKLLYSFTDTLMPELRGVAVNTVSVLESASIDYNKYNSVAEDFISTYNLSNVESRLVVTMHVNTVGESQEFDGKTYHEYSTAVVIPLCERTIAIENIASAPNGEAGLLACHRDLNPLVFKVLGIVFAAWALLAAAFLIVFIRLTRNEDIDYEQKVKRILNAYRSYIQVLLNEFDSDGYQILTLGTFNEMLGIRDTIQSPILMYENEDKTRSLFFIPTNTKILYVFEIKVDDYDELYAPAPIEEEPLEEEPVEEEALEEEPVEEEAVEAAIVVEEPVEEEPVVEEPVVAEPVEEEPIVAEPVEEEPVVEDPVEEEPVVEDPVEEEPIEEEPVVEEAVEEEPIEEEPVEEEPVVEEPIVEEPVVEEPVVEEPIVEEPVEEEPIEEEPVVEEPVVEEPIIEDMSILEASVSLDEIDYIEDDDTEEEEGIEVIGVVWPEHKKKNKVYKYDPDGEKLHRGDIVLVPSHDRYQNRDIVRQAAVAHGNYKVDPEVVHFPLKKIIRVIKRGLQSQLDK